MEMLDVLDDNGIKIGTSKSKNELYKIGGWFRSVHIWIINSNNEILLQKRSPKKTTFPNLWAVSVSGHVSSGESSINTAIREIKEELDININEEQLEYLFTIKRENIFDNCINRAFDDIYLLKLNVDISTTHLQKTELTEIKYFNLKYFEESLNNNDPRFVPLDEEKRKLFNYLNNQIIK